MIAFILSSGMMLAQTMLYTGTVIDTEGEPLIGVNVVIKGTSTGTVTDYDGSFEMTAARGDTVIFSYIGYRAQELVLGAETMLDITMATDAQLIDEVVVIGYGTSRSKDLTSAITTVRSDELAKTPTGQPMQALQGRVAGVQIVSSGGPGDAPTVRIRGIGSYPGANNEAPLYVVDGMFFDNIDFLNTNDIASISVLKDASAAAIYGVRAANGVVLIETKTGGFERATEITYDGYAGSQVPRDVLKMANAEQFTNMALESGSEPDMTFIQNAMQRYGRSRINPNVPAVNTDWYDVILRNAFIQNHSVNLTGGSNNAAFSVGASYYGQDGILKMRNNYERFNLRSRIEFKATDWLKVGGNAIVSNATKYGEEDGAWFSAYFAVPIMPVFDESKTDATPLRLANAQDLGYRGGQNPLVHTNFNQNLGKIRKLFSTFFVEVDLIPDKLTFKSTYNYSNATIDQRNLDFPYFLGNQFQRENSAIYKSNSNFNNHIWDNLLTFTQRFGNHNLTVMGGTSYRDEQFGFLSVRAFNFPVDQETAWFIDQAETLDTDRGAVGDGGSRYYGLSYFGRVAYNFSDRYLVYGTFRADGSNKYQEKWGYFPTVGVGWVISEEDFFNV
ncbi:MAG: SusC/RagA family TonB-linked outer membrane protein, partial [Saprospiraceae bacterium]|nr:SusC/RagA family TonB-linked outer membrane protein [Saprospiraceae bacterium]